MAGVGVGGSLDGTSVPRQAKTFRNLTSATP